MASRDSNLKIENEVPGRYSEEDLVQDLLALLPKHFRLSRRAWSVEREVGVGRSIADVVLLIGCGRNRVVPPTPLTITESVVLAALKRSGPTRIDLLENRLSMDRMTLRGGCLDRLEGYGLITLGAGGRIAAVDSWHTSFHVIAIEAKLTRWRNALSQAIEYRKYADFAFVALPSDLLQAASQAEELFKNCGVGLLSVSKKRIESVFDAEESSEHDWRRPFIVSRLARAYAAADRGQHAAT